jgi:hypothetical protein
MLKNLPMDAARLGPALCISVEPKTDLDGVAKVDRNGVATWVVAVALRPVDGRAALIEVSVAGEPTGLAMGMPVTLVGLEGFFWEMGDRAGVSFRADSVVAAVPDAAPAAPKSGAAK